MPEKMFLNHLSVVLDESKNAGRKNTDPNKPLTIPIPQRKMTAELVVQGTEASNSLMQEYQKTLKSDKSLQSQLNDITFLMETKKSDSLDDLFTMNLILEKKKK